MPVVVPLRQNPGISMDRVFPNGVRNPKFDETALQGYQPAVFQSALNVSRENLTGDFPPALPLDYVQNHFVDYSQDVYWRQFGRSLPVSLFNTLIAPANITYKDQTFTRVLVMTAQNFKVDIPDNPRRLLDDTELDALPVVTIAAANSPTTVAVSSDDKCTICMNEFTLGANAIQLKCGHVFYEECIKHWLKVTGDCPNCKRPVRFDDFDGVSVRIQADGPASGGVLGLRHTLLNECLGEDVIARVAGQDFGHLCSTGPGNIFPLMETVNFTVLPVSLNGESNA